MSLPDGLLWALGTATLLLTLRRQTRPAPAAPVPVFAACPGRSARKEPL
jgi:hypothetical protein